MYIEIEMYLALTGEEDKYSVPKNFVFYTMQSVFTSFCQRNEITRKLRAFCNILYRYPEQIRNFLIPELKISLMVEK